MKPHVFHPQAREEYIQAVRYYSDIRPELGASLYAEIERLIQEIRREPTRFFEFSPPARRALARRFSVLSDLSGSTRAHMDPCSDARQAATRLLA